jgi:transposase
VRGRRYKRIGIVAEKCGKNLYAPCRYKGTMDGEMFEKWFEEMLMKDVSKGSVIMMDNAGFHRKEKLTEIAEKHEYTVYFCHYTRLISIL